MNADRRRKNRICGIVFFSATLTGILVLVVLLLSVINETFGYVILVDRRSPADVYGPEKDLAEASKRELVALLEQNSSKGLMRKLESDEPFSERSRENVFELVLAEVIDPRIVGSWSLFSSVFEKEKILDALETDFRGGTLQFRSWLSPRFITGLQSGAAEKTGIVIALCGSLLLTAIAIAVSFPLGVGAAIYLQEYAKPNGLNSLIRLTIYNLAGIPSIIYGMLGLAVFVRFMAPITSGKVFGAAVGSTANGRTVLSAGLTLGLLILPIIIINAQEAIKGVPNTLRLSAYGLGATKSQTIMHHVLPSSVERILTGSILAVSRALGETAPLVVVGASTFVSRKPTSVFSKFTALPVQIYQWTARPQPEFRKVAAAAIIVLLALLLTLNAGAIILRSHQNGKRKGII